MAGSHPDDTGFIALTSRIMPDGSREFAALDPHQLVKEWPIALAKHDGVKITQVLQSLGQTWLDFEIEGSHFEVSDAWWGIDFDVLEPTCPDTVLEELLSAILPPSRTD